jgi:phosphoribosylanthranilate isomerase
MARTRVKFCGMTRATDVEAAVEAGADAVGFVCYSGSTRFVTAQRLPELARAVAPFVTPVLLFVNATADEVRRAIDAVPGALLQFHGDESPQECTRFARPFVRAVRVGATLDLLDCERMFEAADALLADAPGEGFGGTGRVFDWSLVPDPASRRKRLILAGGLSAESVGAAIARVRPFAVDVSGGVEQSPGIKSPEKMRRFIAAVRAADRSGEPA